MRRKFKKLGKILLLALVLNSSTVYAQVEPTRNLETVIIGQDNIEEGEYTKEEQVSEETVDTKPKITFHEIIGEVNPDATGLDYYKNLKIKVVGENLTDDNILTKEGLYWSDKSKAELITGEQVGNINDERSFGKQNNPLVDTPAFTLNKGDSGRISFVGKTKSGQDLDLIWTVEDSDTEEWKLNSPYRVEEKVRGLAFAGEQTIPDSTGNSIVVLYNQAGKLKLKYQIVKHGSETPQEVLINFITTDIDAGQGVETNLANIVEHIPEESGLSKKDGIIYDTVKGIVGLNGSKDLPRGAYLGAGLLSNFDYTFYAPAPERASDYKYPIGVRYDIFGSALQTDMLIRYKQKLKVEYVDQDGNKLKDNEHYFGYTDLKYQLKTQNIDGYKIKDIEQDFKDLKNLSIKYVYQKEEVVTTTTTTQSSTTTQTSTISSTTVPQTEKSTTSVTTVPQTEKSETSVTTVPQTEKSTTSITTVPQTEKSTTSITTVPQTEKSTTSVTTVPQTEKSTTSVTTVPRTEKVTTSTTTVPRTEKVTTSVTTVPRTEKVTTSTTTVPKTEKSTTKEVVVIPKQEQTTKQAPQTTKVAQTIKQAPQTTKVVQTTKQAPQTTKVVQTTKQIPQTTKVVQTIKQIPQTTKVVQTTRQVPQTTRGVQSTVRQQQVQSFIYPNSALVTNGGASSNIPRVNTIMARNTAQSFNSSSVKATAVPRPQNNSSSAEKDIFEENTGIKGENKKLFLDFIKNVANDARAKHGNDKSKINHAVANALAYSTYHDHFLQSKVNDFGEKSKYLTKRVEDLLYESHNNKDYHIDFPHLAAPVATDQKSGLFKEFLKAVASTPITTFIGQPISILSKFVNSIGNGTTNENFYQQNSLTGDILSGYIDDKDRISDQDALIFKYHPEYKDLTLDQQIEKYYNSENLDEKRKQLYRDILTMQSGGGITPEEQEFLNIVNASLTLGGIAFLGLVGYRRFEKEWDDYKKSPEEYKKKMSLTLKENVKEFKNQPLKYIEKKITAPLGNLLANGLHTAAKAVKITSKKVYNNNIKPIINKVKPVVKKVYNKVVKPIVNKVKPVVKKVYNKVVKPIVNKVKPAVKKVYNKVVKPIVNKVVKPVMKKVYNRVVKPVYNRLVKPVYNNYIRPVARPIYNHIVRPIVQPIYNRVIKPVYKQAVRPVVNYVWQHTPQPVKNFINKYTPQPVKNFFSRLVR